MNDFINITFKGRTQSLPEWCNELNLRYGTINSRINRGNWDPGKALLTPIRHHKKYLR
jgi:hypothetical protein